MPQRCWPYSMANRWTKSYTQKSCSARRFPANCPSNARFIYETAIPYFEKRGIPTRVLHAEKTYLDCFYHVVSRGNAQGKLAAFPLAGRCAIQRDCKVPPLEAYKRSMPPGTVSYLGIAADEPIRLERLKTDQVSLMAKYRRDRAGCICHVQAGGAAVAAV